MKNSLLSILAALALAGCGNSLDGVNKLSDADMAENQPDREVLAASEPDTGGAGFLARIMQRNNLLGIAPPEDASAAEPGVTLSTSQQEAPSRGRGLLSRLRATPAETAPDTDTSQDVTKEDMQIASLAPVDDTAGPLQAIRGLFSARSQTSTASETDAIPGVSLPFGQVARACGATKQDMGQRVEKASHGFALYDSQPGATGPRDFFITGFSDGCPRQFTAALAIFGAPSMHEKLRYGRPSEKYPYSDTDKAYEKIKSKLCGVSRGKPCGSKISRLERNTVFISTYERFTGNGRWADILVHDGAVLAASLKDL